MSILEIEPGSSVAGTKISEPYLQIGLNSSSYANLTDDALLVVKNACYYLLGMSNDDFATVPLSQMDTEVTVYPNPVTDCLYVSYLSRGNNAVTVSVYDMSGKTVLNKKYETNAGQNELRIERDGLASGEYILLIEGRSHKVIVK